MDKYALSWTTEIFYFYFFQNILNNKIVVQVIKFTANSTWKRQAVFLIMQFEKHMSKHKWISLLRILPARLARHSSVGWKAVNRELWLLPSLLSPAFHDLLQCLELQSHSNTCRYSKELFWSCFTDGIIQSKEKQKYKSRGDRKMPFVSSTSPANFNSFSINPTQYMHDNEGRGELGSVAVAMPNIIWEYSWVEPDLFELSKPLYSSLGGMMFFFP